jgi:hypothetical protein
MPYILRDTKEMREYLERAMADSNERRVRAKSSGSEISMSFYAGEMMAYEHALELLSGLEKGREDSEVVKQLLS